MHRAILQSCAPWFLSLCVAAGLVLVLVQYCGGRMSWRKLKRLGSCEEGAVQSLSLVLTLPVFILLVLFIIQVTQVMVGVMMVHYAAFAGARAASVWIPADLTTGVTFEDGSFATSPSNSPDGSGHPTGLGGYLVDLADGTSSTTIDVTRVSPAQQGMLEPANVIAGFFSDLGNQLRETGTASFTGENAGSSTKFQKIVQAAVIPCLTISPSRSLGSDLPLVGPMQNTYHALVKLYPLVDPISRTNPVMRQRLRNKLSYASNFTTVELSFRNVNHPLRDIDYGPTYNPYAHPARSEDPSVPIWNPSEIGFRDPVTVTVTHQFALLPGIGRILSYHINPENSSEPMRPGQVDRTADLITRRAAREELYTIPLQASATFVNEGFKSVFRHAVQP